jgi:hypothetical protein
MKADDARRVMQAGPFTLAVGAYRLMTSLSRGGEVLGENEWAFTVSAHDEAATS